MNAYKIKIEYDNNYRKIHGLPMRRRKRFRHQTKNWITGNHKKLIKNRLGGYWMPIKTGWVYLGEEEVDWK